MRLLIVLINHQSRNQRYIYDCLYGVIYLPDFVWDIFNVPELQRLREIRLCNINSLSLTGGANINRFEHSVGTCFLANQCLETWPLLNPINHIDRKTLLYAALLHDIASGGFGHSVEYIESRSGFSHEQAIMNIIIGEKDQSYEYRAATLEPIYFGMRPELFTHMSIPEIQAVSNTIEGKN